MNAGSTGSATAAPEFIGVQNEGERAVIHIEHPSREFSGRRCCARWVRALRIWL